MYDNGRLYLGMTDNDDKSERVYSRSPMPIGTD